MAEPEIRYAALLRGVDVGGHNRVATSDLREVLTALGLSGVTTLLQSGNVVFNSPEQDPAVLRATVKQCLADSLGLSVEVMIRNPTELSSVLEPNPLGGAPADPARYCVASCRASSIPRRHASSTRVT
jgi:uncharacterized protein (DUF1697 family)